MTIELIPFKPSKIIPEGNYLVKTQKKYGTHFIQVRVIQSNNRMSPQCTNQHVTHISTKPLN